MQRQHDRTTPWRGQISLVHGNDRFDFNVLGRKKSQFAPDFWTQHVCEFEPILDTQMTIGIVWSLGSDTVSLARVLRQNAHLFQLRPLTDAALTSGFGAVGPMRPTWPRQTAVV